MDLDASMKKIQTFMNDFHAIFPGGAAGLKDHAAAVRAGDTPSIFQPTPDMVDPAADTGGTAAPGDAETPKDVHTMSVRLDTGDFPEALERMKDVVAIAKELEAAWPQVESLLSEFPVIRSQLAQLTGSVAMLQAAPHPVAHDAPQGGGESSGEPYRAPEHHLASHEHREPYKAVLDPEERSESEHSSA